MTTTLDRPTRQSTGDARPAGHAPSATPAVPDATASPAAAPSSRKPVLAASGGPSLRPPTAAHLSDDDVARLGAELDAIREEILASRGAKDAAYIRRVIAVQRGLEVGGRAALVFARFPVALVAGTGMLSAAKILENMEIGHNVLHGQWDWMKDPDIHSTTWEWDFVAPAAGWKHSHNDLHHTYTNVVGKDRDVGYNILRMDADQPWKPRHLLNPVVNAGLAPIFEWGIALFDLELDAVKEGTKSRAALRADLRLLGKKFARQIAKDYVATPGLAALTGSWKQALLGAALANATRNVWAHAVIFCGHFPDGADTFTEEMIEGETRGDWYLRQMLGSANISGSPLMHVATGNLSHQIEHHLFPDLPSNRYAEVAVKVRDVCDRYGLPYTTGPLLRQVASTWRKVFRLALP